MYNKYGIDQYEQDGVKNVEYTIHNVNNKSLYTWIYASIGGLCLSHIDLSFVRVFEFMIQSQYQYFKI